MFRLRSASLARQLSGLLTVVICLSGCATRRLPTYEPPLARSEFQTVRTTAYNEAEADHLQYGARNALGGRLRAAAAAQALPPAVSPASSVGAPVALPVSAPVVAGDAAYSAPVVYGSAAADWSRWPAGTVFRLLITGQLYRVDDYGWALSGRNTIDLYMPTRQMMNAWEVRREPIQILQWGDRDESLRLLRGRDKYRHIRRMVLELEGKNRAAARLE